MPDIETELLAPFNCMHCNLRFDDHDVRPDGDRACRDGKNTFNVVFEINPAVGEFIKENLDKSPEELADLWIDKVRRGGARSP